MNKSKIKICGIKNISALECCINNHIDFFGLIFYPKSHRNINYEDALTLIDYSKNKKISSVGVFVNHPMQELNQIINKLEFDYIQLHGSEDNEYIKEIKKEKKIKIIKVVSIGIPEDTQKILQYPDSDLFLFDYKPANTEMPGGNAKSFDWTMLQNIHLNKPWFISGGININNINNIKNYAITYGIDISSGVEDMEGNKDNNKIELLVKNYESK